MTDITDVVQSRTKLRQSEAKLPSLLAQQRNALFMLATLTGDPPADFPAAVANCSAPPLLRRKIPIGVNASQLYPTVKLSPSLSALQTNITDMDTALLSGSVGPMISWTFPKVSVTRAKIKASKATARRDLANFDGYVPTALREAETDLVRDLDAG